MGCLSQALYFFGCQINWNRGCIWLQKEKKIFKEDFTIWNLLGLTIFLENRLKQKLRQQKTDHFRNRFVERKFPGWQALHIAFSTFILLKRLLSSRANRIVQSFVLQYCCKKWNSFLLVFSWLTPILFLDRLEPLE